MRRIMIAGLIFCLATSAAAHAGEFNETLKIGDIAPAWVDLPGTDGKKHSLTDLKAKELVVVLFTCNSCPVAVDYENRIVAFARKHCGADSKVAMTAINVNLIEADRLPKMKERASAKGFTFPYLFDETQKIAKQYGALFTPEFFVLDKDRRVVYMGALDDKDNEDQAKVNHLEQAVAALLAGGKPPVAETQARGCRVRYARRTKK